MKIRDRETFILFVIGISLSVFILINGYQLLNGWLNQMLKKQDESGYRNTATLMFAWEMQDEIQDFEQEAIISDRMRKSEAILDLLMQQNEVVYIDGMYFAVGNASEYQMITVILSGEEEWYRTLTEGSYPSYDLWQRTGRQAVISETVKKHIEYIGNNNVIKIEGVNYEVDGIFENYDLTNTEEEICIYYKPEAGENGLVKKLAKTGGNIYIHIGSNYEDITENALALKSELEKITETTVEVVQYEGGEENNITQKLYIRVKGILFGLLFLVSLLNCWQITRFWITRRKRDLAIMSAFGMSNWRILGVLLRELMTSVLIASGITIILNISYGLYSGKRFVDWSIGIRNVGWLVLFFLIIIVVTVLPAIGKIWRLSPIKGIKGE